MRNKTNRRTKTKAFDVGGKAIDFKEPELNLASDDIATREIVARSFGAYLPNPDPILKAKGKDISIYRDIEIDSRVGSAILSRESALKKMSWRIIENKSDKKTIDIITYWLSLMNIDSIIGEMFDGIKFGYKPLEILWKYDEETGWILPLGRPKDENGVEIETEGMGIIGKPPEWFMFDNYNRLLLKTLNDINGTLLPNKKFILCRNRPTYLNPYGEPLMAKIFWPVTFKKAGLKFWVGFAEKYGFPWVTAKYKPGTKVQEQDALLDMLENMVLDGVAVFQDSHEIEFHEGNRSSSIDTFERLADFCNKEISTAVLGGNLTTDVTGGALASTQVHQEIRADIVENDSGVITAGFNDVIKFIVQVNTGLDFFPEIEFYDESLDEKAMSERDEKLSNLGLKFTKEYFMKTYGLGEKDFDLVNQITTQVKTTDPTPNPSFSSNKDQINFAQGVPLDGQDMIDGLLEKIEQQNFKEMSLEFLAPVFKLVAESKDYSEILAGLAEIYPQMSTQKLENVMSKALFLSEATGVKTIQNETKE